VILLARCDGDHTGRDSRARARDVSGICGRVARIQEGMRLFYLIVTTLLLISLGLLEVAAGSLLVTP
jgi:hypothetical protein